MPVRHAMPPTRRPVRHRPILEALEDRTLLSGGSVIDLSSLTLDPASYAQDHILVRYHGSTPNALVAGTAVGQAVNAETGLYRVNLSGGVSVKDAVNAYRSSALVASAEPDYLLSITATPNDPRYGEQTYLSNIAAPGAWNTTTSAGTIIVAVMDTGIDYTHPDLYLNIWLNQGEIPTSRKANLKDIDGDGLITFRDLNNAQNQGAGKITDINGNGRIDGGDLLAPMTKDAKGLDTGAGGWANGVSDDKDAYVDDLVGWNSNANTNNPMDDAGHGTHVAGIIGALGNNGLGVTGVAWKIQLMPVKFFDAASTGSIAQFVAGLNYAVAHGAKISNNSWSGAGVSQTLHDAIAQAKSKGHIFVAAAGNLNTNIDSTPNYPASYTFDSLVTVGASDSSDKLASYSNYGKTSVDIVAPGSDILSTAMGGSYVHKSGTSMATPQVTAALALVWAQHPTWTYKQVIDQVLNNADKISALDGKIGGSRRLNVAAAVGSAATPAATAPAIVSSTFSGSTAGSINTVRVTFDRAMVLSSFTNGDVYLKSPDGTILPIRTIKVVTGSGDKAFDLTFDTQTKVGTYTLKIGPYVTDLSGTQMAKYETTYTLVSATSIITSVSTASVSVPNKGRGVSLLAVDQAATIGTVTVKVNITHPYVGDLYIYLQGPDGTVVVLVNRKGGASDNFVNTVFSDSASKYIGYGIGPFTGSYQPEVPLSTLAGKSAKGTWKLWVEDRIGHGVGTINNWSVTITPK